MKPSLELHHARAIAAVGEAPSPFAKIQMSHALMAQSADMQRVLTGLLRHEIRSLRDSGTPWAEMAERTGLTEPEVIRLAAKVGASRGTDASAREPSPAR